MTALPNTFSLAGPAQVLRYERVVSPQWRPSQDVPKSDCRRMPVIVKRIADFVVQRKTSLSSEQLNPFYLDVACQPLHVRAVHLAGHRRQSVGRAGSASPATGLAQVVSAHQPPRQRRGEGIA
jgi:hypothetical protein